jgi:hypothetical protein
MDINLSDILPYIVSAATGVAGIFGGMRLKKANEKKAEAEAEAVKIDNEEKAAKIMMDYVVEPLKKEMTAMRREMAKFRRAIERIKDCQYSDNCPVREELKKKNEDEK